MPTTFNPIAVNFDGNPSPKIRRYNSWNISLVWTDSDNVGVDLSYYSAVMHIRKNTQSPEMFSLTTSNGRITLSDNGDISLNMSPVDTTTLSPGSYVYDLLLIDQSDLDSNGDSLIAFTILTGSILVEDSITRESI